MIRTTYKGRELKILKARQPNRVRQFVGGHIVSHGWEGTEAQALDHLRLIIDRLDAKGVGNDPHCTSPHWYEPGTYMLNHFGHVIAKDGGSCLCDLCLMWPAKNVPAEMAS
jgi:hypothetical protein